MKPTDGPVLVAYDGSGNSATAIGVHSRRPVLVVPPEEEQ